MSLNLIMSVHTELFICKLCGYVSHGKERPTKCPACGAPSTAFAPYQMMAEAKRLKILDFDLHQISTHFGVGIILLMFLVFVISWIWPSIDGFKLGYGSVLDFFAYSYPFFVVLTFALGLVDGKVRYKKLDTKYLRYKIIGGISLGVLSVLIAVFNYYSIYGMNQTFVLLEFIFILIALGVATFQGMIGKELVGNVVPRGREVNAPVSEEEPSESQ